jgi:osmoprotectant transport system permease protein
MIALLLALVVGSKQFTESVILGEIATQALQQAGIGSTHRRELGGTRVLWEALRAGQIDLYPEYTGTLSEELLHGESDLPAALEKLGLRMSPPLGFEDNYAIGMRRDTAQRLGLHSISDLAKRPELRLGFSNEFMRRRDGWPLLRDTYDLPQNARGLEHALAYRALTDGAIDATDLYSTDAEIRAARLVLLDDDRHLFQTYAAVWVYRAALPQNAVRALARIHITQDQMIEMNARALLEKVPESTVASEFLGKAAVASEGLVKRVGRRTLEHLFLVGISLGAAILISIPLGILAYRRPRLGARILAVAGIVQTIPSLALLVFMIPLLGIGAGPAIVALFLYSLLPIIRGTHTGLSEIAPDLRETAHALGLPDRAVLRRVELPLASRSILSGIKTAAVINVGTATLGALIGAGGYGEPILTGIRLADTSLILEGAIPAALLAIVVQALFDLLERFLVPAGLRLSERTST